MNSEGWGSFDQSGLVCVPRCVKLSNVIKIIVEVTRNSNTISNLAHFTYGNLFQFPAFCQKLSTILPDYISEIAVN